MQLFTGVNGEKIAVAPASVDSAIELKSSDGNGNDIYTTILHVAGVAVKVVGAIDDVLETLFGGKGKDQAGS
jgi:hypothetical protein